MADRVNWTASKVEAAENQIVQFRDGRRFRLYRFNGQWDLGARDGGQSYQNMTIASAQFILNVNEAVLAE